RILDGDRRVGGDLFEDCFRARDQVRGRDDFVDKPNAVSLLRAGHRAGQNELKGAASADQPRQPLRAAAAGKQSQLDLALAELRVLHGDADGAGHRRLPAAAQRQPVDGRTDWLAEILNEMEHLLPERLDRSASIALGIFNRTKWRHYFSAAVGL